MADVKGNVNITIGADVEAFKRAVEDSKKKTKSFSDQLVQAAATTAASFGTIKVAVLDSVKAFGEADRASRQLDQALLQQGLASDGLAESYDKLALQTAQLTGQDDDAVKATFARAQAYLGTIEITEELTTAAANLAAGLNIDLDEAFTKIAKSATGTTNLLKKQQITIDETGTSQEKLAQILKQVESRFGGQAEASKNVLTSFANFETSTGNLVESLGGQLAPAIRAIVDGLARLAQAAADNKEFIKFITVVGGAVVGFISIAAAMSSVASIGGLLATTFGATSAIGTVLAAVATAIGVSVGALVGIFAAVVVAAGLLYAYWDKIWPAMQAVFHAFIDNVGQAARGLGLILKGALTFDGAELSKGMDLIAGAFKKGFAEIRAEVGKKPETAPLTPDEIAKLSHQQAINEANKKARQKEEAEVAAHAQRLKQIEANKVEILKLQAEGGSSQMIALKQRENAILEQIDKDKDQRLIALLNKQKDDVLERQKEQAAIDSERRKELNENLLAENEEYQQLTEEQKERFYQDSAAKESERLLTDSTIRQQAAADQLKQQVDTQNKFLVERQKYGVAYATINKALNSDEVKGFKQGADDLVALTQSKNGALKAIGKAAAVGQIAIQSATAAMNIYAGFSTIPIVGVPLGIAGAAAAIAFGVERTADVVAAADGGLITGGIPGVDSVPALLQRNELVVPAKSFEEVVGAVRKARGGENDDDNNRQFSANVTIGFSGKEASQFLTVRQLEDRALGVSQEG